MGAATTPHAKLAPKHEDIIQPSPHPASTAVEQHTSNLLFRQASRR
jgi:hypothetical protein